MRLVGPRGSSDTRGFKCSGPRVLETSITREPEEDLRVGSSSTQESHELRTQGIGGRKITA